MKKVLKLLFLFILIGLIVGGIYFVFQKAKVQKITCESQLGKCNPRLLAKIESVKKENIFVTRISLNNLLKDEKSILGYTIEFRLPLNLIIHVIERQPVIAFLLNNGKYALVDQEGVITEEVMATNLPKIVSINLNQSELQFASDLISSLYKFFKPVGGIKITADGIEVDNIVGKRVIFPLTGDRDILLGSLNLIISRLPSVKEASTIGVIDLRFKNPVLK